MEMQTVTLVQCGGDTLGVGDMRTGLTLTSITFVCSVKNNYTCVSSYVCYK
jgi:hypothetical protein